MRFLVLPSGDHRTIYDRCAAATEPTTVRQILIGLGAQVIAAGHRYLTHAGARLHQIAVSQWEPEQKTSLEALYSEQLVASGGVERTLYSTIRASTTQCPYCTFGEVYEVDHFLPKSRFPEYALLPANLVPICHPCNHTKHTKRPLNATQYLLHPYFDRLPEIPWLFAELSRSAGGPLLTFRVSLDAVVYGDLAHRLAYHFETLRLDQRFRMRSAVVLAEIEDILTQYLGTQSAGAIATHFVSEAERFYRVYGNSLEAAAFRAASENYDYCAGLYRN